MMILKKSLILASIFLCGLCHSVLHAQQDQGGSSPTRRELFLHGLVHGIKVVRIVVQQTYESADKANLPFYVDAERILKYAGFKVVGGDAAAYDATLSIRAVGIPRRARYSRSGELWTAATVSGTIAFSVGDRALKSWNFYGFRKPTDRLYGSTPEWFSTPNNAPFSEAKKIGFDPVLFQAVGELKGPSPLIAALKDESPLVRQFAAKALGIIKDPLAVGPLISTLKDAHHDVQTAAAEALGVINDPRAIVPLIAAYKAYNFEAARAISKINDPRATELLIAALKDKEPRIRDAAAEALGYIKDPRAVEPLLATLKDQEASVRGAAASALGSIGDPRAVGPLIVALKERHSVVGDAAEGALERITRQKFSNWQEWQKWWEENRGNVSK